MVTEYAMSGYVIIPPTNQWDDKSEVIPGMSYNTFGRSPKEAWLRHMGTTEWDALKVDRWVDFGYTLKEAKLTIMVDED